MLKLFSIFSFVLLYISITFGQVIDLDVPTVDIPLFANDGSVPSPGIEIAVGLDLTATDGIDTNLGEAALPPLAPGLDVRFNLAPYGTNETTYKDYRAPGDPPAFPYTGTIEHTIILQHSAGGLDIDLDYDLPAGASMTITDQIGGSFLNIGPFTGVGTATVPGSYLDIFTSALLFMDYVAIVPVELTSFTAAVSEEGILLNWNTATEINNQGFEIERISAGQSWTKIGYVPGFGTTTEPKSYSFIDENVLTGTYSYRLKQIDYDGTFAYSDEVVVEVDLAPQNFELFQNYPNPFNPTTTIQFQVPKASDVSIVIYDMLGQEVISLFSENVQAGSYSVEWNGINNAGLKMSSGSYIYRMTADEFVKTKEMILLK